jgi:hypothetical protein
VEKQYNVIGLPVPVETLSWKSPSRFLFVPASTGI